jgi:hypothetical protein
MASAEWALEEDWTTLLEMPRLAKTRCDLGKTELWRSLEPLPVCIMNSSQACRRRPRHPRAIDYHANNSMPLLPIYREGNKM